MLIQNRALKCYKCDMKIFISLVLVLAGISCPLRAQNEVTPAPIVFLSDFGTDDDAVSQCKGVIYSIAPQVRVVDATHNIPAFDVRLASFFLREGAAVWPAGTVFLAVVDPGVGTGRKAIVMKTKSGHYFVGPDNGLFTLPARKFGLEETREIYLPQFSNGNVTSTFHGRDKFAPVAASIAKDPAIFEQIGPVIESPKLEKWPVPAVEPDGIEGSVMFIENAYGNVWTDISEDLLYQIARNQEITLRVSGKKITLPFTSTYGDVEPGKPLAYINSRGFLSLAINMGNFAKVYGVNSGDSVKFEINNSTFIDISRLPVNGLKPDLRYATPNNFTGMAVYPSAQCYLRKPAADALVKAAALAEKDEFALCVLDCYRPVAVQEKFWELVPDERYVANPKKGSKHNRGMAVDVAACDNLGNWLELPTEFDDFSPKAAADSTDATPDAIANRAKLQTVMKAAGFSVFPSEWWHSDYPGWEKAKPENFPFETEY